MKEDNLLKAAIESLQLTEAKDFYRLSNNTIMTDVYQLKNQVEKLYKSLSDGSDYDDKQFKELISDIEKIRKQAKGFNIGDKIPIAYEV